MKKLIFLVTAAGLLFSLVGCQEKKRKDESKLEERADIKLFCVAEFLRGDGSKYLTEQKYEIFAGSKTIKLTAKEPFGEIIWSAQNGGYTIQKGIPDKVFDKELYNLMMDQSVANGLLEIYLAGLTKSSAVKTEKGLLIFEGRIYEPVKQKAAGVNIYRNQATGKLDLVTAVYNKTGKVYLIHGFNYQKIKQGQNSFYPSKLDIYLYLTDMDKELIAQISSF
jgi:hypothetical protein